MSLSKEKRNEYVGLVLFAPLFIENDLLEGLQVCLNIILAAYLGDQVLVVLPWVDEKNECSGRSRRSLVI